jgi:hypothetical protein
MTLYKQSYLFGNQSRKAIKLPVRFFDLVNSKVFGGIIDRIRFHKWRVDHLFATSVIRSMGFAGSAGIKHS